jgi:uncharacterized membrane protein YbhN (UPF0104 family)
MGNGVLLGGWLSILLGWVLFALSLWAALEAIGAGPASLFDALPRYTASVALAMVAGFAALTPAGLGVRDAILMELLAPVFASDAAATALVSAVLVRLIWLVAELVISGILYFMPARPASL